jgi:predicted SprT family Zn-dependent metalloprotease
MAHLVEVEKAAREAMDAHGLGQWKFRWTNSKREVGNCMHTRRTISLSREYAKLNTVEEMMKTVIHEIAHALAVIRHGMEGRGHGWAWKAEMRRLGLEPRRLNATATPPPAAWVWACCRCGYEGGYTRRPKSFGGLCGACLKQGHRIPVWVVPAGPDAVECSKREGLAKLKLEGRLDIAAERYEDPRKSS